MQNKDYCYIDIAFNGVNKRNNVINIRELKTPVGLNDCYRTVYRYPDEFKQHFDRLGTVAGYKGSCYADFMPLDIDAEDLTHAHEAAREVLERLMATYDIDLANLRIYFSGAKGFHIMIPAPLFGGYASPKLPIAFKKMAAVMLRDIEYDSSIYDVVRLFRLTNTVNSKTGLYKIPVTAAEVLHKEMADIMELAKGPRKLEFIPLNEIDPAPVLKELFVASIRGGSKQEPVPTNDGRPPKDAKLCYYELIKGVESGERDNAAIRLAVFWRKHGLPGEVIHGIMTGWNRLNSPPLEQTDIDKAVQQACSRPYDFGCNDDLLQRYCTSRCHLKRRQKENRITAANIYTLDEARDKYREYLTKVDQKRIRFGIPMVDKVIRGVAPGEVAVLLARSGVGKTAAALNLIRNVIVGQKVPVLFYSLEMPVAQIYERICQISGEIDGRQVESIYRRGEDAEVYEVACKNFGKLYVCDQDFLTIDELRDFYELATREKVMQAPGLIVIDYLGRMKGGHGSSYEITSELVKNMKNLAKELDVAVVYLHQTSREGGTGKEPVTIKMARDSGQVEESADYVVGMWRPELEQSYDKEEEEMMWGFLKVRNDGNKQVSLRFHKKYLTITEWDAIKTAEVIPFKEGELPFD